MNPDDPESAQQIVAEYARAQEQHGDRPYPASIRTLPYPKATLKRAIVTCRMTLERTGQLTDELLEFLETAYVSLADYLDDELVRVMAEYREATASIAADTRAAREKVHTPAWQRIAETSRIAGDIARGIADDAATLRLEFRAQAPAAHTAGGIHERVNIGDPSIGPTTAKVAAGD
jgi:hypothetical protein